MITIYHDQRSKSKSGTYPLKFRIACPQGYFYIPTGIYLPAENFDASLPIGEQVIRTPLAASTNISLKLKYLHMEEKMLAMPEGLSLADIKNALTGTSSCKQVTFTECLKHYADSCRRKNTRQTYIYTLNKLKEFSRRELTFEEINISFLKNFDAFLARNIKTNTRSIIMRDIRTVFNYAIDEEIIQQNIYPFRKFKIKKESTRKRSLTIEEIKTLRDYPVEEHQKKYRDIFMLIFYLRGINIIDLCGLKKIENGRINYRRAKTGRLYSVKVEPEAQILFDRYRGKNYLLDVLDRYKNYEDFYRRTNRAISKIGPFERKGMGGKKIYTPLFPELSTYWARHTWATIASELDIPKETIAAGLGHGDRDVTDVYIRFDEKKVDAANRLILDAIK
jgi:site-specific recombinase XerD